MRITIARSPQAAIQKAGHKFEILHFTSVGLCGAVQHSFVLVSSFQQLLRCFLFFVLECASFVGRGQICISPICVTILPNSQSPDSARFSLLLCRSICQNQQRQQFLQWERKTEKSTLIQCKQSAWSSSRKLTFHESHRCSDLHTLFAFTALDFCND